MFIWKCFTNDEKLICLLSRFSTATWHLGRDLDQLCKMSSQHSKKLVGCLIIPGSYFLAVWPEDGTKSSLLQGYFLLQLKDYYMLLAWVGSMGIGDNPYLDCAEPKNVNSTSKIRNYLISKRAKVWLKRPLCGLKMLRHDEEKKKQKSLGKRKKGKNVWK